MPQDRGPERDHAYHDGRERAELAALRDEVHALRAAGDAHQATMEHLATQVSGLVDAWNTAQGLVRFVRWTGSLALAIAGIWAVCKLVWDLRKGG